MRTILYLRKSTDDNKHQKASLDDQRAWAFRYIEELRAKGEIVDIVKTLEEKKTAKEPGRPLFGEMMAEIYNGWADTILTWDIDRLSRNEVDEGTIKWAIRQGKIKQVHTHNSIYTEHELLTMSIFLSLGAEKIAKMRQRVMRRMKEMLKEGKVPYKPPYGYKNTGEGNVAVVEEEARFIKRAFELRANGIEYSGISDVLYQEGFRTRSGKKVGRTSIEMIIKQEFYKGVVFFAGEYGKGSYKRFISDDLFARANGVGRGVAYEHHEYPLKGILYSSHTGKPLTASFIKKKYNYYHSHNREKENKVSIGEHEIIEKFGQIIHLYTLPKEMVPVVKKALKNYLKDEWSAIEAEMEDIEKGLRNVREKMNRLKKKFVDDAIDEAFYHEELKNLVSQERSLSSDQSKLNQFSQVNALEIENLVELLTNLSGCWKSASDAKRLCMIKDIVVELFIDSQKTLKIHEKEVFTHLSLLNYSNWLPLADLFRTKYREDISNLGRLFECNRGIREMLQKPSEKSIVRSIDGISMVYKI